MTISIAITTIALVIVGAFVYVLAAKAEAKELGRLTFACALLALLLAASSGSLSVVLR